MQHPFQCIATVKPATGASDNDGFLLAACGPKLTSICLSTGHIVSEWRQADVGDLTTSVTPDKDQERPAKRQKIGSTGTDTQPNNVIRLTVSPNNQYVVAVTNDKCVRVFSIGSSGELVELSSRCMPKRPCAVQVLPDNTTILCGDKFGDVYSLPLLPELNIDLEPSLDTSADTSQEAESKQDEAKPFKPSATNKTVHTQRNLKSLAAQQNQKNLTPKMKEPLKFKHKLLLGHVSMLTDVKYARREVDGKPRGYIITADRDEHIRVSRAPPQAHVIEGYCLGHKEFVSKLCLIPGTDLLVGGGGDDWIGLWEWPEFRLHRKVSLSGVGGGAPTAVSGIWFVPAESGGVLIVACERASRLLTLHTRDIMNGPSVGKIRVFEDFENPILDVASIGSTMFVSLDARAEGQKRIRAFALRDSKSYEVPALQLERANGLRRDVVDEKSLDDLLYGIENLRKRGHHEEAEDV